MNTLTGHPADAENLEGTNALQHHTNAEAAHDPTGQVGHTTGCYALLGLL